MKKEFIKRVIREGIVDTRKYRYLAKPNYEYDCCKFVIVGYEIVRLDACYIDCVQSLDELYWSYVCYVHADITRRLKNESLE